MRHAELLALLDEVADAPNGVGRIREVILTLATRGRLVPQDPDDEPAHALLARIRDTRATSIASARLRKAKTDSTTSTTKPPFAVPSTWAWCHVSDCTSYVRRGKSPIYADSPEVPVVSQKCVQWTGFDISRARFIKPTTLDRYDDEQRLRPGDLLWNSTGLGTLGRIIEFMPDSRYPVVVADSHVTILRPALCSSRFLWFWFAGPYAQSRINKLATGSTKQTELATGTILRHLVPLPPLAEQLRIVKRVDALMELCDELEAQQLDLRALQAAFAAATVHALSIDEGVRQ